MKIKVVVEKKNGANPSAELMIHYESFSISFEHQD